jgi:hypothetical protein
MRAVCGYTTGLLPSFCQEPIVLLSRVGSIFILYKPAAVLQTIKLLFSLLEMTGTFSFPDSMCLCTHTNLKYTITGLLYTIISEKIYTKNSEIKSTG